MNNNNNDENPALVSFIDREPISKAIHKRAALECGRFARARKIIVAYPSLKDRVKHHLAKDIGLDDREKYSPLEYVNKRIRDIGCPYFDPTDKYSLQAERWNTNKSFKQTEVKLLDALERARKCHTGTLYQDNASKRFGISIKDDEAIHDDSLSQLMTQNGFLRDETGKEFTKQNDGVIPKRIRVRIEPYSHNHGFHIIEDISEKFRDSLDENTISHFTNLKFDALSSLSDYIYKNPKSKHTCQCKSAVDCKLGNMDSGDKLNCRRGHERRSLGRIITSTENLQGQPNSGALAVADYWIVPCKEFFDIVDDFKEKWPKHSSEKKTDTKTPSSTRAEQLRLYAAYCSSGNQNPHDDGKLGFLDATNAIREIQEWAGNWFNIKHQDISLKEAIDYSYHEDFVFSFISDGRALLISDLRPNKNWDGHFRYPDHQTRTIIIDLALHAFERGRILQRLMDIASFRNLGLRGYPYAEHATEAVTRLGISLSELSSSKISDWLTLRWKFIDVGRMSAKKKLKVVRQLSKALDMLNLFFTYGVNGRWDSSNGYSLQIKRNIDLLREHRIPGHQTLNGYMQRYYDAAHDLEVLKSRYNTLRGRLNEATNLIKTDFERSQSRTLVILTFAAFIIAVIQVLALFIDTNEIGNLIWNWLSPLFTRSA